MDGCGYGQNAENGPERLLEGCEGEYDKFVETEAPPCPTADLGWIRALDEGPWTSGNPYRGSNEANPHGRERSQA